MNAETNARRISIALAVLTGLTSLHAVAGARAAAEPLGVRDVLSLRTFARQTPIMLSADGNLVAYTLTRPASSMVPREAVHQAAPCAHSLVGPTDVWLTNVRTGESRNLTNESGANWGAAWSPDGQLLAFYSDREGAAHLWLWDRRTDALRRVSQAPMICSSIDAAELQWTPDGKQVLVRMREAAENGAPARPSLAECCPRGGEGHQDRPTVRVFHSTGTTTDTAVKPVSVRSSYLTDLALIHVRSGEVRKIARGVNPFTAQISPDGKFVAFMDHAGAYAPGSFTALLDLKLVSLAGGELRTLAQGIRMGGNNFDKNDWSWSPDSQWLAYRDSIVTHEAYDAASWVSKAFLVSVQGQVRPLSADGRPQFRGTPVWDDTGQFVYFFSEDEVWRISSADGGARAIAKLPGKTLKTLVTAAPNRDRLWAPGRRRAAVVVAETLSTRGLEMGFYSVQLDTGQVSAMLEEDKRYVVDSYNVVDNLVGSPLKNEIVYVAEDAQRPQDLWLFDAERRQSRRLSRLNPSVSATSMGRQRLIDWTGRDGQSHTGFLLLPSDYREGQRYPLVAWIYPMTPAQFANTFGYMAGATGQHYYNMQLLATRGYAVLLAGAPIQAGEPMQTVADWALPGIDRAVELGVADADRIGIIGASAGGYCVLSLIVQSTRFKAAVEHVGPGNLLSVYGTGLDARGYSHGQFNAENAFGMAGHPWEARDQYIRNSPWFFLDRVTTPLLILHGAEDTAVPISQPNEIFVGLKRLGKEVQYALYEGEGHGIDALPNQIDAVNRYIAWFDERLKGSKAN